MSVAIISWLLALSFVSDFIKRHSVDVEYRSPMKLPRWIGWGRWTRGDYAGQGPGLIWLPYLVIRVPGWYWESRYEVHIDEIRTGWARKYLYWRSNNGWSQFIVFDA